ncbi:hypothetical protein HDV00_003542 [Rhizophlyctis rosea]|nr:hypothetical protein HDV00_003542 [Rhizophlyctis rosea]
MPTEQEKQKATQSPASFGFPSFSSFSAPANSVSGPSPGTTSHFPSFPIFSSAPAPETSTSTSYTDHKYASKRALDSDGEAYQSSSSHERKDHRKRKEKRKRSDRSPERHKDRKKKDKKRRKESSRNSSLNRHSTYITEDPLPFTIDRRGDMGNLKYGSVERSTQIDFKRYGDKVYGASDEWRIAHGASKGRKEIHLRRWRPFDPERGPKVTWDDFREAYRSKPVNMKRLKNMVPKSEIASEDFVTFPDLADVLSNRNDIKSLLDEGDSTLEEDAEFVQQTAEYNKRLQQEPKNLQLWLDFVDLQDRLVKDNTKKSSLRTAVNEKKQSIYLKALDELPNNETLLSGYMRTCEESWEFGEEGALGWAASLMKESDSAAEFANPKHNVDLPPVGDEITEWLQSEVTEGYCHWLPLRPVDDEEDDPYRAVLFDDIRKLIFEATLPSTRRYLFFAFLNLLGIPVNGGITSNHDNYKDAFLRGGLVNAIHGESFWPQDSPVRLIGDGAASDDSLSTSDNIVRKSFSFSMHMFPSITGIGLHEFASKMLLNGVPLDRNSDRFAMYLSVEAGFNQKTAAKLAKSLLKNERMDLTLWAAYATVERERGNVDEVKSCHAGSNALRVLISLADDALDIDIESGDADASPPPPTRIAKASKLAVDTLSCSCLFQYLTQGLDEARNMYDETIKQLRDASDQPSVLEEVAYEEYARLMYRHSRLGAFKPGLLREVLERALERFPSNTIFLSLYGLNEARTQVENRVRRFLNELIRRTPSDVLWIFSIWSELHQRQSPNMHIVRSLFERALECATTKHSIIVWHLYVELEVREGNLMKAKALFFRAIRECPWSKELYLLPFKLLREVFDDDELVDIHALMEEKELRLRKPLVVEEKALDLEAGNDDVGDDLDDSLASAPIVFT